MAPKFLQIHTVHPNPDSMHKTAGGGGFGKFRGSETRKLLIFRHAKNAEDGKIAVNWNVSGTRDFFTSVPK